MNPLSYIGMYAIIEFRDKETAQEKARVLDEVAGRAELDTFQVGGALGMWRVVWCSV